MRILVVTRSYPAPADLYRYPFVHRRVLAYAAPVTTSPCFARRMAKGPLRISSKASHATAGTPKPSAGGQRRRPSVLAVHGLSEQLWPVVEPLAGSLPIRAWLHGSKSRNLAGEGTLRRGRRHAATMAAFARAVPSGMPRWPQAPARSWCSFPTAPLRWLARTSRSATRILAHPDPSTPTCSAIGRSVGGPLQYPDHPAVRFPRLWQ